MLFRENLDLQGPEGKTVPKGQRVALDSQEILVQLAPVVRR